jgi:hypothetical protein
VGHSEGILFHEPMVNLDLGINALDFAFCRPKRDPTKCVKSPRGGAGLSKMIKKSCFGVEGDLRHEHDGVHAVLLRKEKGNPALGLSLSPGAFQWRL